MIGPSDNGGSADKAQARRRRRRGKIGATKFTQRKQKAYLKLLEKGNRRMASARAVGVDNKTVQRLYKTSPKFRLLRDTAEMGALEVIEDAVYRRAKEGQVGAAIFILCNRNPEKWRHVKTLEVSGPGGGPVPYEQVLSEIQDEREKALQALTAGRPLGNGARSQ